MGCKQSRIVEEGEQNPFREPQQCHPPEIFRINQHTLDKFQCPIMWGVLNHPAKGTVGIFSVKNASIQLLPTIAEEDAQYADRISANLNLTKRSMVKSKNYLFNAFIPNAIG